MNLDLTLDKDHHDGFFTVEHSILEERLAKVAGQHAAHVVYIAIEAKGEILPYFFNETKTLFGEVHQDTIFGAVFRMFANPQTQSTLQDVLERLVEDVEFCDQMYTEYDSKVRPYSLVHDISFSDIFDLDEYPSKVRRDLSVIADACRKANQTIHNRIALAYVYIVAMQKDPVEFFKPEQGPAGIVKRNMQARFTGIGHEMHERVFRALLDYGQYFEDRYKELLEMDVSIERTPDQ